MKELSEMTLYELLLLRLALEPHRGEEFDEKLSRQLELVQRAIEEWTPRRKKEN